jgi:hypothetical protein
MIAGELLVWLAVLDVFMTVLYARVGTSIVAGRVAGGLWRAFRWLAGWVPRWKDALLSFAGPVILVAIVACWTWIMDLGTAMIIYPNLGHGIRNTSGPTSTSFLTALYAGGISLSVVGSSSYSPQTTGFRMFYLFNSLVGTSVLSLTLTYLMQVYNALQRRASLALRAHLSTGESGDAADLLLKLGPQGQFSPGYTRLSEFAAEISSLRETYDHYPVLLYFRYRATHNALARVMLLGLDTVSLARAALDDNEFRWIKESAAMEELWRGCMNLQEALAGAFLPEDPGRIEGRRDDPQQIGEWGLRYRAAVARLRQANIATCRDEAHGEAVYIDLRGRWNGYIDAFARFMAYDPGEIDWATRHPEAALGRRLEAGAARGGNSEGNGV